MARASAVAAAPTAGSISDSDPGQKQVDPPSAGATFDYQIGKAYPAPDGVRVVSRDSGASPQPGLYNVCYINAFQSQPGAEGWWQSNHPDLLLRDADGGLVIDKEWNEPLLDISTDGKRAELAEIEYGWIDGCAGKGFQAVEPDNLDSYGRSSGLLDPSHAVAFATLLAQRSHADGLAIGQKNTAELLDRRQEIGFDFAVSEQCGATGECGQYASAYGGRVLDIEYGETSFAKACDGWRSTMSVVRRDRDLTAPGDSKYVYRQCS
ncbi:endo alpha-1,4 polygalactosaminidase [Kitasatospora sp. NPDC001683]